MLLIIIVSTMLTHTFANTCANTCSKPSSLQLLDLRHGRGARQGVRKGVRTNERAEGQRTDDRGQMTTKASIGRTRRDG